MVVIVISGMPGAGSSTIARLLAKKLKLNYFSMGRYFKEHYKEATTETEKALKLMATKKGKSSSFHHSIDKLAISLAEKGNVVIDGKIAIRMVGKKADLCVWLKALEEVRARRYAERGKTSIAIARQELEEKERTERAMWKKIYGFDYFAQEKDAGVVIDTSDRKPDEIVSLIIRNMKGGFKD